MRPATRSSSGSARRRSSPGAVVVERLLAQLERLEEPLELVIDDLHELALRRGARVAGDAAHAAAGAGPGRARDARGAGARPAPPAARGRADRAARARPALLARRDAARCCAPSGIALSDPALGRCTNAPRDGPAGLRLAAISLAAHPDPERFVSEFSGSERTVAGYLLAEVLERQPPEVRDLLLRTSILDRVSGPLADALTGGAGAEAILQRLEDAERVRHRARRRPHVVSLPPPVRRSPAPRAAARRAGDDPVAAPRRGRVARAAARRRRSRPPLPGGRRVGAGRAPARGQLPHADDGRARRRRSTRCSGRSRPMPTWATAISRLALAIDSILHGLLDEAAAHLRVARRLADGGAGRETAALRRLPGRHRGRARPPAQRSGQGAGGHARLQAALERAAGRRAGPCGPTTGRSRS